MLVKLLIKSHKRDLFQICVSQIQVEDRGLCPHKVSSDAQVSL